MQESNSQPVIEFTSPEFIDAIVDSDEARAPEQAIVCLDQLWASTGFMKLFERKARLLELSTGKGHTELLAWSAVVFRLGWLAGHIVAEANAGRKKP